MFLAIEYLNHYYLFSLLDFGIGGSIFQYYIELGKFSQQNQDIILNLRYEDMKKVGCFVPRDVIESMRNGVYNYANFS